MDFTFTEEGQALRDLIRDFAAHELTPQAKYYDETGEFPWENLPKLAKLGVMGANIPEEYGGAGISPLA